MAPALIHATHSEECDKWHEAACVTETNIIHCHHVVRGDGKWVQGGIGEGVTGKIIICID